MSQSEALKEDAACLERYERHWDAYSQYWDDDSYFRRFRHLGDEWGDEAWVRYNIDTFAKPYIAAESSILEIGPGGGRYTHYLARLGNQMTCVDVSASMIERVQKRLKHCRNARFIKNNGMDLAGVEDSSVDFIWSSNVFLFLDIEVVFSYLSEIQRVLRPDGHAALQYAVLSSQEGWGHFAECWREWAIDPLQRGRFSKLTLSTLELLADKAGLGVARNQHVARDAVAILSKQRVPATEMSQTCRRDYGRLDQHLDELAEDIYHEEPTDHHRAAAHEAVDSLLADVAFDSVLELGCGAAPCLDRLAERGKQTHGVSYGDEPCAHPVVRADMHFSGLSSESFDVVISRHALEHSVMPLLLLMEVHRICRTHALVVVPCDEQIWIDWPNHYSVFSKAMWRRLFQRARFEIVEEQDGLLEPDSTEWRFLLRKANRQAAS